MRNRKVLKSGVSEMLFPAFWGENSGCHKTPCKTLILGMGLIWDWEWPWYQILRGGSASFLPRSGVRQQTTESPATHGHDWVELKLWPNEWNIIIQNCSKLLSSFGYHVASCCMVLNEVGFPSNIWCNIVQHFFCFHVSTTKLHSFGRARAASHLSGKGNRYIGLKFGMIIRPRSLITTIRICTAQHVAFVWPCSSTPSNNVEGRYIRLAEA